jgi:DNA-binding winged helix-turn-helix (wHTH) protein
MRYEIGELVLDIAARQLRRGDVALHLSPKAFDLLEFLIEQRPRAVPKQELYDRLWPKTFVVETNLPLLIAEIRTALGDDAHQIIRTVHRHGYAFAAEARQSPGDAGREAPSPHVLVQGGREFRLIDGENVVGRNPSAQVRIVSSSVSRRHAVITVAGDTATIVDLESKNGTQLDGKPLANPELLTDGAVIAFGTIKMIYRWSPVDAPTETATC